ncbi:hypothetical protein Phou_027940 [Phytohabitans houttuyneae]|uniref:Uncharacterized protein n=1 Tax=Phytohabitans houttuyneae TaxID=1076126 RepID=A0A6V8K4F8_9ACTN|nr:hypothetical protein Phou_027940 [Phytohabitans houttuyneae]
MKSTIAAAVAAGPKAGSTPVAIVDTAEWARLTTESSTVRPLGDDRVDRTACRHAPDRPPELSGADRGYAAEG